MLEIENLSVRYGEGQGAVRAVEGVSLTLERGEILGLAGESGSGKSTLAYGACRLLRAPAVITSGSVVYRGRSHAGKPVDVLTSTAEDLRRLRWSEIAIVFQSAMSSLNPVLSVEAQLSDVLRAHSRLDRSERRERSEELLGLVGISADRLGSFPHELSGGMRQRVMIAMALALRPDVVIMDEPTTALDVVMQREILHQIIRLQRDLGFAVLFITHDLSLLLEMADRVAVMYAGRLVEVASAETIYRAPKHPYTQGLLGSFPSLHGERHVLQGIPGSPPDMRSPLPGCSFAPRCPQAEAVCREAVPPLLPVMGSPDPTQRVACVMVPHPAPGPSPVPPVEVVGGD
ncbi:MAG: ABC transporter ATP-binding protein [Actinomycetota bacterium]|nr:ABC transporter ATP-binding protein [Actinomycetota bacterium]